MRQVEKEVIGAFIQGKNKRVSNTESRDGGLYLFGNKIVEKDEEGYRFRLAGWNSPTTRSRLNSLFRLLGVKMRVSCKDYTPYLDGKEMSANMWYRVM